MFELSDLQGSLTYISLATSLPWRLALLISKECICHPLLTIADINKGTFINKNIVASMW